MRGYPGTSRAILTVAGTAALALAGCGGAKGQDAKEPSGTFTVDVVKASFPTSQRIAGQSRLELTVRNPGSKAIPDVAVTIRGAAGAAPAAAFGEADPQVGLADPSRPVWILDRGPRGGDTAYVNTWALGRLRPNEEKTFTWYVTPAVPGSHTIRYEVAAGLNGKAKAQLPGGGRPVGTFTVAISDKPAQAKVSPNGSVESSPAPSKATPPGYPVTP